MLNNLFLNSIDKNLADWLLLFRSDLGLRFFSLVSYFGNWQFLSLITLIIILCLFIKDKGKFIIPFFMTVAGAEIVTLFGKVFFERPRPLGAAVLETDFSFPSGHATSAVTFYGFLAYLIIKHAKKSYHRIILMITFLIVFLIGFSRLYLGVHYLSDVLAGYMVGIIFLVIGIFISNR